MRKSIKSGIVAAAVAASALGAGAAHRRLRCWPCQRGHHGCRRHPAGPRAEQLAPDDPGRQRHHLHRLLAAAPRAPGRPADRLRCRPNLPVGSRYLPVHGSVFGRVVVFQVTYSGVQGSRASSAPSAAAPSPVTGPRRHRGAFRHLHRLASRSATARQPRAGGLFAALGLFLFRRLGTGGFLGGLGPGTAGCVSACHLSEPGPPVESSYQRELREVQPGCEIQAARPGAVKSTSLRTGLKASGWRARSSVA